MFCFSTGEESELLGVIYKSFSVLDPIRKGEKRMAAR